MRFRLYGDPMVGNQIGPTATVARRTYALTTGNGRLLNYVDWTSPFLIEDGSPAFPFRMVRHAVSCMLGGATISVRGRRLR
jgi:hypothetical protein